MKFTYLIRLMLIAVIKFLKKETEKASIDLEHKLVTVNWAHLLLTDKK